MFGLGFSEILLILIIVFVLFGAGKLPKVMEDLGKGMKSFRKGMEEETDKTKTVEKKPGE